MRGRCEVVVGGRVRTGVLGQGGGWQPWQMLGSLVRLVLFRFLGARVLLALTVFGWLRRLVGGRRTANAVPRGEAYQPSQGESQIVQRDPR